MNLSAARSFFFVVLLMAGKASSSDACAVCFAGKGTDLTHGLNMAICSLLCVVVALMGAFATFFCCLAKKGRESLHAKDGAEL